jgi:transglutaminase-like putative cysteine protease
MSSPIAYKVQHITHFHYDTPVTESVMEVRMHPINDEHQVCHQFDLVTEPGAHISSYLDYLNNRVHHFNIPGAHRSLLIRTQSMVEVRARPDAPPSLPESAWDELQRDMANSDYWEMCIPSHFTQQTDALRSLAAELNVVRRGDPLSLVRDVNQALFEYFEYVPQSTRVDSLIDEAIINRKGVCQDFTHIMLALLRQVGIPSRYVSGYLFHNKQDHDRSTDGASHAWIEAWFPGLGWIGFDPTNNHLAGERHIRLAVGRDYKDVPPTKGVYKGSPTSRLDVAVNLTRSKLSHPEEAPVRIKAYPKPIQRSDRQIQMQQQQQQ